MTLQFWATSFVPDDGLPREDAVHLEHLLADARLLLASSVALLSFVAPAPLGIPTAAASVLLLYLGSALIASVLLRRTTVDTLRWSTALYVVDTAAAAAMFVLSGVPDGLTDVLCAFTVLGAALRWGMLPAVVTTAALGGSYLVTSVLQARLTSAGTVVSPLRPAFVILSGIVLSAVAGAQGTLRNEEHVLARVLARVKRGDRFTETLGYLMGECLAYLHAERGLLALHDEHEERLYVWRTRGRRSSQDHAVSLLQLPVSEADDYFFAMPPHTGVWHARSGRDRALQVRALRLPRRVVIDLPDTVPLSRLIARESAEGIVCVDTRIANWRVRLFLINPRRRGGDYLRFLRRFSVYVGPPLHSQYLLARLRSRVVDVERARIARELHDGLIQSLIGLEMEIDAMRRRAAVPALDGEFSGLRDRLHRSILDARDLMAELRPAAVGREGLLAAIAAIVDRFRMETDIDVRFSSDVETVSCTPRTSGEVARIVQEALVNIRKHAHARHVIVRLGRDEAGYVLQVDDDGRGFSFPGTKSLDELDRERRGPQVIKERVRAIGGTLTVRSDPDRGVCLDVRWPDRRLQTPHDSGATRGKLRSESV